MTPMLRNTLGTLLAAPLFVGLVACGTPEKVSMTTGAASVAGAAQDPPPETAPPGPTEVLLGDLTRLSASGPWQHGDVKINTTNYANGVWASTPCHPLADGTGTQWDFDLNREYNRMTAVLGLSDESPVDDKFRVDLVADGVTNLGSYELSLGVPAQVDAPLTNVLRLSVKITQTAGVGCDPARLIDGARIAFGDAKIIK